MDVFAPYRDLKRQFYTSRSRANAALLEGNLEGLYGAMHEMRSALDEAPRALEPAPASDEVLDELEEMCRCAAALEDAGLHVLVYGAREHRSS